MIKIRVKFKKSLYGNEDSDFCVYSAEPASRTEIRKVKLNKYGNFSVSGDFFISDEEMGHIFTVTIEEDYDSKYPGSYKLIKLHYEFPEDPREQWEFLETANIVPLNTYIEIKKTFSPKDKIMSIMAENPQELTKVKGIGEERAKIYQQKVLESKDKALLFNEFGNIDGVGSKLISHLYTWKPRVEDVVETIKKDPFSLITDLNVGFALADRFRDFYKFPLNDRNRILHGVSFYLNASFQSTGNTYDDIMSTSKEIALKLRVSYREVINLLAEIQKDTEELQKYKLKIFGKNITTESLFKAELLIYNNFKQMMTEENKIAPTEVWEKRKKAYLATLPNSLSDEQDLFLSEINNSRASILLGPGGAGKSWVIDIACKLMKKSGKTFGLFAPTARAAKVMTDYVGVEAQTIHRGLMKYALAGEIAPFDVLIVDEFSMVDSELASIILRSMGLQTRLIIVGDDYQLQSVGPGNVLFDLVEYIKVPTVRLTKIFRQKEEGGLLNYAQALRDGDFKLPDLPRLEDNNIVFINESDDARKQEIAMKIYSESLSKLNNDYEDIMLLTPINKTASGRKALNKRVQQIVNPGSGGTNEVVFGANLDEKERTYFRKGDYVTVTSNVYDMVNDVDELAQIINGDLGDIVQTTNKTATFSIGKNTYTIDKSDIKSLLDHAWSITIHKSQGGQASDVIIVLPESSHFMLNANMIYTAITRAKNRCYVIGNFKSLNTSASKQANFARKTMIQLQAGA